MSIIGLGIDVLEIKRFQRFSRNRNDQFLLNNFTKKELDYCFLFKDKATHLAGTFAAKEAVFKSLGKKILLSNIEIRREKNGNPTVLMKNRKQNMIFLSISHTKNLALAIVIKND